MWLQPTGYSLLKQLSKLRKWTYTWITFPRSQCFLMRWHLLLVCDHVVRFISSCLQSCPLVAENHAQSLRWLQCMSACLRIASNKDSIERICQPIWLYLQANLTPRLKCTLYCVQHRLLQSYIQSSLKDGQGGPEISTWEQGRQLFLLV